MIYLLANAFRIYYLDIRYSLLPIIPIPDGMFVIFSTFNSYLYMQKSHIGLGCSISSPRCAGMFQHGSLPPLLVFRQGNNRTLL